MPISKFKFNMDWKLHLIDLVVVIIGVTVAFGIGELAEGRNNQQELTTILNAMAAEIRQDIDVYNRHQIPTNQALVDNLSNLIEMLGDPGADQDSMVVLLKMSLKNYNWLPSRTTYQSIIQSGKIDLIHNDSLKFLIRTMYGSRYGQTEYIQKRALAISSKNLDYLTDHVDLSDDQSFKNVLDDLPIKNGVIRYANRLSSKIKEYKANVSQLENMLEIIKADLEEDYVEE